MNLDDRRSALPRVREIGQILSAEGLSALGYLAGIRVRRNKEAETAPMPVRLRRAFERLGPTAVKIGQMLSTRADLLPEEYRSELARLQDEVTAEAYPDIAQVFAEEFGMVPDEMFDYFEHWPSASASIGQVHRATMRDGTDVAVKIQRPAVREAIETDITILLRQARWAVKRGLVPGGIDVVATAEQFADALARELDYVQEARNIEYFATIFRGDENLLFPKVHWMLTSRRVLTTNWIDGIRMNNLAAVDSAGLDRKQLANIGVQCYLRQVFELGRYHADPHPGNLFALADNRVAFTDFGRVATLQPGTQDAMSDLLIAIIDRDADLATDAFLDVSGAVARVDRVAMRQDIALLIGRYYGDQLARINVAELVNDLIGLMRHYNLHPAPDFVLLITTLAVLESVGEQIDPDFDFIEALAPYTEKVLRDQMSMREMRRTLFSAARKGLRAINDLPGAVDRALRKLGDGQFSISIRPSEFEPTLIRLQALVDRLALAVIIAAFVIGFTRLLSEQWLPKWLQALAVLSLVLAAGVGFWMAFEIVTARIRANRDE